MSIWKVYVLQILYLPFFLLVCVCVYSHRKNSSAPPPESPPKEPASSSPSQVSFLFPLLTCLPLLHTSLSPSCYSAFSFPVVLWSYSWWMFWSGYFKVVKALLCIFGILYIVLVYVFLFLLIWKYENPVREPDYSWDVNCAVILLLKSQNNSQWIVRLRTALC